MLLVEATGSEYWNDVFVKVTLSAESWIMNTQASEATAEIERCTSATLNRAMSSEEDAVAEL